LRSGPLGHPAHRRARGDRCDRARRAPAAPAMIRLSPAGRACLAAIAAFVIVVLYGPLLVAVFFSFFQFQNNAVQWDSFSFSAYLPRAKDEGIIEAVENTLLVGGAPVCLALVFAAALAFHYNASR